MLLGIGGGGFISGGNGIAQQESPPDMRGRLLALTAVAFLGSTPIGGPITGIIGDAHRRAVGAGLRQLDHAGHGGRRRHRPGPPPHAGDGDAAVPEPVPGG